MKIHGTVALVTGAGAGTGREIAKRLAAEGAAVVVADLDTQGGQETARMIELTGGSSRFVHVDAASSDDVRRMVAAAGHELSGPQILVNNAGGGGHVEPHYPDADLDQWQATLDLNLRGAMLATQLVLDPIRRAGGGVVINIASTAGLGFGPYVSPRVWRRQGGADPLHLLPGWPA